MGSKEHLNSSIPLSVSELIKTYWSPSWARCTPRAWISFSPFNTREADETLCPRQALFPIWSNVGHTTFTSTKPRVS